MLVRADTEDAARVHALAVGLARNATPAQNADGTPALRIEQIED